MSSKPNVLLTLAGALALVLSTPAMASDVATEARHGGRHAEASVSEAMDDAMGLGGQAPPRSTPRTRTTDGEVKSITAVGVEYDVTYFPGGA